jgi:DNA-binding response OmpR family regulator
VQAHNNTQAARSRRLSIFIADDDIDTVSTLAAILRDEGHVVVTAENTKVALEQIRDYKPDVCILDIVMPGKSGFDLAREVKNMNMPQRPIVIFISGVYTRPSESLMAKSSIGFAHFIRKPADPVELLALLDRIASDRPTAA